MMGRSRELAELGAAYDGGSLSSRNKLINGDFRVDQRNAGASHTVTTTAAYGVDRWLMQTAGASGSAQQSAWPAGFGFQTGLALTGAAGVTNHTASQRIERQNMADLVGGPATLSIRAYSASITTLSWEVYRANANDNFSGLTSIASGSWTISGTSNTYQAVIDIPAAASTGLQVTIRSGALGAGQTLFITGAQLEAGRVATPFEVRPYGTELALCQRYYQTISELFWGALRTSIDALFYHSFKVNMRAVPSGSGTFNSGTWTGSGGFGTRGIGATIDAGKFSFQTDGNGNGQVTNVAFSAEL
jgi:hypothetical protein